MPREFAPRPREKLFELSDKPQHDPDEPRRLLDEENLRVAGTLMYRLSFEAAYPNTVDPSDVPPDPNILDAIDQLAVFIMNREKHHARLQLDAGERTFMGEYLGIRRPRVASGKAIRRTYQRRLEYLSTLYYADEFGLTIAEATEDMQSNRGAFLHGIFNNPKLLTEIRRRIAKGNDPEFTTDE